MQTCSIVVEILKQLFNNHLVRNWSKSQDLSINSYIHMFTFPDGGREGHLLLSKMLERNLKKIILHWPRATCNLDSTISSNMWDLQAYIQFLLVFKFHEQCVTFPPYNGVVLLDLIN